MKSRSACSASTIDCCKRCHSCCWTPPGSPHAAQEPDGARPARSVSVSFIDATIERGVPPCDRDALESSICRGTVLLLAPVLSGIALELEVDQIIHRRHGHAGVRHGDFP